MKASILNIGDELLIGQVANSNAARTAQLLTAVGIEVVHVDVCGDDADAIADAMSKGIERGDILLMTGGLGPTKDDITKHVLCHFFDSELYENAEALANVKRIFAARGYELTEVNRKQAWVPRCCTMINNNEGTAPCMWFEREGKVVVAMPGVPFEMENLMQTEVVPRLCKRFHTGCIVTKNILVQGIGESFLSDLIEPWEVALPESLSLAYLPDAGMVKLRLTAKGDNRDTLQQQIATQVTYLYSIAGQYIVGEDADNLPELVARQFRKQGKTLAIAESCTGGSISAGLTALAGASEYIRGGVVAYSNEVKQSVLGVHGETLSTHGAVSEATVRQMAEGIRQRLQSDYAVASSGIAGPGGGSAEKPVGTVWISLATPSQTYARLLHLRGQRKQIIAHTCNAIYAWLVRQIQKDCIGQ